jgi:hypothetical protein
MLKQIWVECRATNTAAGAPLTRSVDALTIFQSIVLLHHAMNRQQCIHSCYYTLSCRPVLRENPYLTECIMQKKGMRNTDKLTESQSCHGSVELFKVNKVIQLFCER